LEIEHFCDMMWKFIWLLTLETALSDEIFTSTYSVTDQCIGLCKENQLPLLDLVILSFFFNPDYRRTFAAKLRTGRLSAGL
jgi:hypothetical protein